MNLNKEIEKTGKEILSLPTAPFREHFVQEYIKKYCTKNKIDFCFDKWGNIWVGTKKNTFSKKQAKLVFVAHMDHPGFHVTKKIKKKLWEAKWFGGGPVKKLKNGPLYIAHENGHFSKGKITNFTLTKNKRKVDTLQIKTTSDENLKDFFGSYDYPGYKRKGPKIYTKAADDLGGVLMILTVAKLLKKASPKIKNSFLGLLTRGEEVGFQGCLGAIYSHKIPSNYRFISVETSNYKAGVKFGSGPVLRLGDAMTLFDSELTFFMKCIARDMKKKDKKFMYQSKVMDGGACEATAFNIHGLNCGGLCVPLGGYHNESENGSPGPEFIDFNDLKNLIILCEELVKKFPQRKAYIIKTQMLFLKSCNKSKKLLKKKFS